MRAPATAGKYTPRDGASGREEGNADRRARPHQCCHGRRREKPNDDSSEDSAVVIRDSISPTFVFDVLSYDNRNETPVAVASSAPAKNGGAQKERVVVV